MFGWLSDPIVVQWFIRKSKRSVQNSSLFSMEFGLRISLTRSSFHQNYEKHACFRIVKRKDRPQDHMIWSTFVSCNDVLKCKMVLSNLNRPGSAYFNLCLDETIRSVWSSLLTGLQFILVIFLQLKPTQAGINWDNLKLKSFDIISHAS